MTVKVIAVFVTCIVFFYLIHTTFGGFGALSGSLEGFAAVGIASIFWTKG